MGFIFQIKGFCALIKGVLRDYYSSMLMSDSGVKLHLSQFLRKPAVNF